MNNIYTCVVYKDMENSEVLKIFSGLMGETYSAWKQGELTESDLEYERESYCKGVNALLEMADNYGFSGNLWHTYLTWLLVNSENAFSKSCEIVGPVKGSINLMAHHDLEIFKGLFDFDIAEIDEMMGMDMAAVLKNYEHIGDSSKLYNRRIRDRISGLTKELAATETVDAFMSALVNFYGEFGVGKFGLNKAFRLRENEDGTATIEPITNIAHVYLEDLVGYEIPKQKLVENTEAFVEGRKANNCLLFGDAGTGKSSSIKGIVNRYYEQGLRIIEVYKHQFKYLNDVIAEIKNRNYRFIIYMDDLSFEEFEIEYKYLKAVIEGGLEKKPENILIYATSNRRHLVRETFSDKNDVRTNDELHSTDTVQEKLSLVARFGVTIYFGAPTPKEFKTIVRSLAERNHIDMPEEELLLEANKWELAHGGLSGRTAQQFIDHLLGKKTEA